MAGQVPKNIHKAVAKKWGGDPEKLGEWYTKVTAARRAFLQKKWDQNPHCEYCNRKTLRPDVGVKCCSLRATYEHKQPISRGGTESRENATLSCSRCNRIKGNMTHEEFNEFLKNNPIEEYVSAGQRRRQKRIADRQKRDSDPDVYIRRLKLIYTLGVMMFDHKIKATVVQSLA